MPLEPICPHVLIGGSPHLSERVRHALGPGQKPALWPLAIHLVAGAPNYSTNQDGAGNCINALLHDAVMRPDQERAREARRELKNWLAEARAKSNLAPQDAINVALIGSHVTETALMLTNAPMGSQLVPDNPEDYGEFSTSIKKGRRFVKQLEKILRGCDENLKIVWFAQTTTAFLPALPAPKPLAELAREVRSHLDRLPPMVLSNVRHDLRPTLPFLFEFDEVLQRYQQWTTQLGRGSYENPFSTANRLVEEYGRSPPRQRKRNAVMVEVVGSDLDTHNPLDPPAFTRDLDNSAADAGIKVVLLDSRVGADLRPLHMNRRVAVYAA